MDAQLARDLALCLRGSAYLRGSMPRPNDIERAHPAFQRVREIKFQQMPRGAYQWQMIAESVGAWLDVGKWAGAGRISFRVPDGGKSGDSSIAIVGVENSADTEWWQANSRLVAKPGGKEERVWSVTYRAIGKNTQIPVTLRPQIAAVSDAQTHLCAALEEMSRFGPLPVRERCQNALAQLESQAPQSGYEAELEALGAGLEVRQLLAAAIAAWCFGGEEMPSDGANISIEPGDFALNRLFSAIIDAFEAAAEAAVHT
jgi:hypothetical protein